MAASRPLPGTRTGCMNASLLFWFVVPDANFISLSAATSGENPVVEVVAGTVLSFYWPGAELKRGVL